MVSENATVQLRPHDLSALRRALEFGHVAPFRVLAEGGAQGVGETGETVQVWRYNASLRLARASLAAFISLVREAEARVWALEQTAPARHRLLHLN